MKEEARNSNSRIKFFIMPLVGGLSAIFACWLIVIGMNEVATAVFGATGRHVCVAFLIVTGIAATGWSYLQHKHEYGNEDKDLIFFLINVLSFLVLGYVYLKLIWLT
ncbi:MAG: hypothetical protein LBQ02_00610 [Candidatus Nomurabacteria bacterium]|jgi:hypothetical protein|nr:hypothetical protein [Candidatus Nomurabacteria bacterium]